jgi:hypothetical protein
MSAPRKKNVARKPINALATAVGYVKTIQINLGGMKAAEELCKDPQCNNFPIRPLSGTARKKKTSSY